MNMSSLLEQLPKIVADGKREAERIMERLESSYRIGLQTRELVIPSRDSNWQDMFAKARAVTALSNAGDEDAYKAAGESIYEAAFIILDDNKQELLTLVEAALE